MAFACSIPKAVTKQNHRPAQFENTRDYGIFIPFLIPNNTGEGSTTFKIKSTK